jgi:hypothetical protein
VIVDKTLTVAHHGGTREITMEEALQQRTYRDALAGKRMAAREVVKWIMKHEAWLAEHEPKASDLAFNFSYDSDNADAALLLLGIAVHNPDRAGWRKNIRRPCCTRPTLATKPVLPANPKPWRHRRVS